MRVDTTQAGILEAVREILLQSVDGLTEKNCFVTLYPDPQGGFTDDLFCTISPADSVFPEGLQVGGAQFTCMEETGIIVKISTRIRTDRAPQQIEALVSPQRGILWLKWQLLRALVGADPTVNGNQVVRQLLWARRCTAPRIEDQYVSIELDFGVSFDWDLTGQVLEQQGL